MVPEWRRGCARCVPVRNRLVPRVARTAVPRVNQGMSKKTRKRRSRKRGKANKGKRPNARH
ncbi:hypothetical protein ACRB68_62400 [Actinomadura sp. RB68]|uniref:Uncharacterized protein n=1 Tax=Actinomadura macrotermitis TaxID=2585200 RepID=A0A7K0C5N3_9ACTN|nr:hypothetical protein [Actinomadura macrotermitis]